jgi:hypothetical protein
LAAPARRQSSAKDQNVSGTISSKRMADGKEWTTANLNVNADPSFCYDDAELNLTPESRFKLPAEGRRKP